MVAEYFRGTWWRSWWRHYATSRKVAGLIPDEVTGFSIYLIPLRGTGFRPGFLLGLFFGPEDGGDILRNVS
jgi:hypothetical protein